jgi:Domain of unknown function (DUF3806)
MQRRAIIAMGLFSFLFGGKAAAQRKPEVLPLPTEVVTELREAALRASVFLRRYVGPKSIFTAQDLDDAIVAWSRSPGLERDAPDKVVEHLGAYFGDYLIQRLGLEWRLFRDAQGTDVCVIHREVFVYSFPHSSVYKAVVQGRRNALAEVESALKAEIDVALRSSMVEKRSTGK